MKRLEAIFGASVVLAILLLTVWMISRPTRDHSAAQGAPTTWPPFAAGDVDRLAAPPATPMEPEVERREPLPSATSRLDADSPYGAIEGRVLSIVDGAAVAGAELTFMHDGVAVGARSAADGSFTLIPHATGRYVLVAATGDGYLPYAPEWGHSEVVFWARPQQRIVGAVVYLIPAFDYVARVVDPEGQPVAGAEVRILDGTGIGAVGAAPVSIETRFVTDDQGEARLHAPDFALLEARHPLFEPGRARLDFAAQVAHEVVLQLRSSKTQVVRNQTIAGRALDPSGAPLAEALVMAGGRNPRWGRRPTARTLSGADGSFELRGLDGGRYDVQAKYPGLASARAQRVATGTLSLELRLREGGAIRGVVREARTGATVAAFAVWVGLQTGPLTLRPVASKSVYDAEGRYELNGLGPGSYTVAVSARGFAAAKRTGVEIKAVDTPAVVDFLLERGGTIVGVVVDEESGAPIADARVTLEARHDGGPSTALSRPSATTGTLGRFALTGVAAGVRAVTVVAMGYNGKIHSGLQIQDARETGPVTIELSPLADGERAKLELAGIGVRVEAKGESLRIRNVMAGSGAAEAGLVDGDLILEVEGQPVIDLGFEGALQQIRGQVGTVVQLTIRRADVAESFVVNVVRKKIRA